MFPAVLDFLRWLFVGPWRKRRPVAPELIASDLDFEEAARLLGAPDDADLRTARDAHSSLEQIAAAVKARMILGDQMELPELVRYVQHLQSRAIARRSARTPTPATSWACRPTSSPTPAS